MNAPTGRGEVIIGDITCLPLKGDNFCYLACFQDKFTRRIVGWQISERIDDRAYDGCFETGFKPKVDQSKR
ncbi:MAG: hypothetical protein ACR2MD_13820, partial [Aridibacter sp.]